MTAEPIDELMAAANLCKQHGYKHAARVLHEASEREVRRNKDAREPRRPWARGYSGAWVRGNVGEAE